MVVCPMKDCVRFKSGSRRTLQRTGCLQDLSMPQLPFTIPWQAGLRQKCHRPKIPPMAWPHGRAGVKLGWRSQAQLHSAPRPHSCQTANSWQLAVFSCWFLLSMRGYPADQLLLECMTGSQ